MEQNVWFWGVTLAVLLPWALDLVATWLNLRALNPRIPEAMTGVFDAAEYAKSQEYTRVQSRFGQAESAFSILILLAFWWGGGFGWLDGWVRMWGQGPIVTGLIYISLLLGAQQILSLPFDLYGTFVIEARFGFNQTTLRTFFLDRLKGIALGALIGLPLMAVVLWIFQSLPSAWLWGWGVVTFFSLILSYIGPAWIMPLFNRFTPLEEGELRSAIAELANRCRFGLRDVLVMDGSKRSTKSNAFFTGFGRNKRIALFDTLIARHATAELVAVLAHEIGHYQRRHIFKGMALGIASTGVLFFLLGLVMENRGLFAAFGVAETSVYLSLVFFGFLVQPLNHLL
ncbi:MAG: M48 family metallopeptidase, partial [Verrucomicrobiae bacterium]|nr:M48 family metallopeptidase [Verrucomicrobiae bacterium]